MDYEKKFTNRRGFCRLIVGAGFASGQKLCSTLQVSDTLGIVGAIIATIAFASLGMTLAQLGSDYGQRPIKGLFIISVVVIWLHFRFLITFFLFGVAVVMFAGSGSTFNQMFGVDPMVGSIIMVVQRLSTLLLNVKNIINIIASGNSVFNGGHFVILIYSIFTMDLSMAQADNWQRCSRQRQEIGLWVLLLYVSYNIAAGAAHVNRDGRYSER